MRMEVAGQLEAPRLYRIMGPTPHLPSGRPSGAILSPAGMAELVDALDSKSSSGNRVGVRFPLPVPRSFCDIRKADRLHKHRTLSQRSLQ